MDYLRRIGSRRIAGMVIGVVILSLGIAIFKESMMGNDPITAFNIRLAEILGLSLGVTNLSVNLVFLLLEFIWGRKYIGIGTLFNGACVGYMVTFFHGWIQRWFGTADTLPVQLVWVLAGVIITSFGASLYQTADLGIAPYDYLALGIRDHSRFPYFGCRMFTDGAASLSCFLMGGLIGLGTLVCVFGFGPFIAYFNTHVSQPLISGKRRTSVQDHEQEGDKR